MIGSLTQATATSPPPPPPTPAPTPTRYEQTDTHFAFAGTWGTFSTTGASGGGYKRTNASGSSVTVSFNGTYLAWIATKGTTLGKAKVSLDGGAATTVDLAAASVAYQQKVWNTGTLASGNHTVRIEWDTANAGKYVSIDAFDVIGTVLQVSAGPAAPTPKATRHEQNSALLTYAGGWTASSSSSASGGSFRFADSAGSAVTVTFTGSYLAWIAKKSPVYGKAKVTVDGGTPVSVDLYSANTLWQQKVWDTGTLASGAHTVRIEWTGSKSSGATDTNINVDALDIVGTLSQAPAVQAVRYEQNDTHFAYVGMWTASSSSSASGGSFRFADSAGSAVTVTFTGSYLAWIAKKSPVYGKAKVTVDGGTPMIVDLYSPSTLWKQKVWEKTLGPGAHTLRIEWTGTKSTSATETNIGVDAFDLIGVLQ